MKTDQYNDLSPAFNNWLKAEQAAASHRRNSIIAVVSIVVLAGLAFFLKRELGGSQEVQPANTKHVVESAF